MQCTGAKILMECLVEQGVDTIFGYPGGTILNVYDELYNYEGDGRIKHILTAHEQGACHAADGYARSTGRVGVCFATSGPGCTNLVTGIATAYMDSSPIVCITCNVGTSLLGKDSFQEVDITGITMPITKCNYLVRSVDELADVVREAFAIARSGRPGPVLIDIPKNVTAEKADYEPLPRSAHGTSGRLGKLMERGDSRRQDNRADHQRQGCGQHSALRVFGRKTAVERQRHQEPERTGGSVHNAPYRGPESQKRRIGKGSGRNAG